MTEATIEKTAATGAAAPNTAPAADASADNAKRRQILEGARTVFRAKGFDGASMDGIAKEAGVSKGTLYVYFTSKEALFEALILEERLEQAETFLEIDGCRSDIRSDLVRLGTTFVEKMARPEKISTLRMVVGAAEKFPQFGALLYEAGPCRGVAKLAAFMQQRIASGELKAGFDTEIAAGQFFDLCLARMLRRMLLNVGNTPTAAEIRENVEHGVDVFLAAYGKG